ncbi:MAG: hypothetical protein L0Z46_00060 [Nitrospiraceae bacterium]|nr:hypothetical protein [Nitrospiraceae bacterium]
MLARCITTMIGGVLLLSLTACAESLHQTQRMATLSQAQENGYAGVYDPANPFYSSPGFWWSPFAYYPGFSGYGPGYRSGYPYLYPYSGYYSGRPSASPSGPSSRPSPPANAPPQFFKRK